MSVNVIRPRLYRYTIQFAPGSSFERRCWMLTVAPWPGPAQRPPPPWEWTEFFSHLPSLSGAGGIGNMRAGSNKTYLNFKCSFMTFYNLCCCTWHMLHGTCSSSTQYSVQQNRYIGWKGSGSCVSLKIMIRGWSLAKLVTISRMVSMVSSMVVSAV